MTNIIKERDSFTKEIVYRANNWSERDLAFFNQIKFSGETPESLRKTTAYYLQKFYLYEQGKRYLGWNWPAFLWTAYWGIYRRLYSLFFLDIIIGLMGALIDNKVSTHNSTSLNIIGSVILVGCHILFGCYANTMYVNKIVKKMKKGSSSYRPKIWPLITFFIIFLTGFIALEYYSTHS